MSRHWRVNIRHCDAQVTLGGDFMGAHKRRAGSENGDKRARAAVAYGFNNARKRTHIKPRRSHRIACASLTPGVDFAKAGQKHFLSGFNRGWRDFINKSFGGDAGTTKDALGFHACKARKRYAFKKSRRAVGLL